MAKNIEIKASAANFMQQQRIAENIAGGLADTLIQEDTFFNVEKGRLKLREFPDAPAQLIFYHRSNATGPTLSDYHISTSDDADGLKSVLQKAYGIRHVVKKVRKLFLVGRTRLHFDTVENLGEFIELEVVLADSESTQDGENEAQELMQKLGIQQHQLIDVAYVDLLERSA